MWYSSDEEHQLIAQYCLSLNGGGAGAGGAGGAGGGADAAEEAPRSPVQVVSIIHREQRHELEAMIRSLPSTKLVFPFKDHF